MNNELGMHDAVVGGKLVRAIPTRLIFVADSNERDNAIGSVDAGTIVATYGCGNVWQKKGDGTWATIK